MENSGMPPLPSSAPSGAETAQPPAMPQPQVVQPKHIEVVATGLGFYENHRKVEGDRFTVPSIEMTGSWMRCIDPRHEKARVEWLKAKKKKANSAAVE